MLYIIATPIGNLEDITLRALKHLKSVDFIICEDTRHTGKLLKHFEITTPMTSFHSYSSEKKIHSILDKIEKGQTAALVSDAGTPGISDPGYKLKQEAKKRDIQIVPIPGASAFLTALQGSSSPINKFIYLGFLPIKKGRKKTLETLVQNPHTIVFYESVHRIKKTLCELSDYLGETRHIIIAREITKLHEEFFDGTLQEAIEHFTHPKGEFVFILPVESKTK
jgi:16S rRNA (cytidine1402-2'-O)-methyltransferase